MPGGISTDAVRWQAHCEGQSRPGGANGQQRHPAPAFVLEGGHQTRPHLRRRVAVDADEQDLLPANVQPWLLSRHAGADTTFGALPKRLNLSNILQIASATMLQMRLAQVT